METPVIDRKFIWPLEGPCRDREAVAREIDGLSLPETQRACLRALLAIIWPDNAPADWRPGEDGQPIALDTIAKHMGCSLNSARPKVDCLEASGWIQTREQRGAPRRISISWGKFFELRTAGRGFGGPLQTPPTPPDPSNSNASTFGGVGGVGDLHFGGVDPSFLEGLEGYSPTPWRGTNTPDGYEPPSARDIKTLTQALNRLATAIETMNARTETPTAETTPTPPTLEASNPSNPSKIDPTCMSCQCNVHDMQGKDLDEQEEGADEPLHNPSEEPKMPRIDSSSFVWSAQLFVDGLKSTDLQRITFRDQLWQNAQLAGWPADGQGRIQFHASVLACLRAKSPGSQLTACVRKRRWGDRGWWRPNDIKTATALLMNRTPSTPATRSETATERRPNPTPRRLPARDAAEVDQQIANLSNSELRGLLPEAYQKHFDAVLDQGKDPVKESVIRAKLRNILAPGQQPASIGSLITAHSRPAPVPGLELSGLNLGDLR